MREALGAPHRLRQRRAYAGVVERFGSFPAGDARNRQTWPVLSLLLRDIVDRADGQMVADHVWVPALLPVRALGHLDPGEVLTFTALALPFRRGYAGHDYDKRAETPRGPDYRLAVLRDVQRQRQDRAEVAS